MADFDNYFQMTDKKVTRVINGKTVVFNAYRTALTHFATVGDVGLKAKDGATVLCFAARSGKISLCKWLIEETHLDVNARLDDGVPALGIAVEYGCYNLCRWLIDKAGADVNPKDINGVTLLEYVEKTVWLKGMAKLLRSRGAC